MLQSIMGLSPKTDRLGVERVALVILKTFPKDGTPFTADQLYEVMIENQVFEKLELERDKHDKRMHPSGLFTRKMYMARTYKVLKILEQVGYVEETSQSPKVYKANSAFIQYEWDRNMQNDLRRAKDSFKDLAQRYGSGALRAALSGGFQSDDAPEAQGKVVPLRPNTRTKKGMAAFVEAEGKQR